MSRTVLYLILPTPSPPFPGHPAGIPIADALPQTLCTSSKSRYSPGWERSSSSERDAVAGLLDRPRHRCKLALVSERGRLLAEREVLCPDGGVPPEESPPW